MSQPPQPTAVDAPGRTRSDSGAPSHISHHDAAARELRAFCLVARRCLIAASLLWLLGVPLLLWVRRAQGVLEPAPSWPVAMVFALALAGAAALWRQLAGGASKGQQPPAQRSGNRPGSVPLVGRALQSLEHPGVAWFAPPLPMVAAAAALSFAGANIAGVVVLWAVIVATETASWCLRGSEVPGLFNPLLPPQSASDEHLSAADEVSDGTTSAAPRSREVANQPSATDQHAAGKPPGEETTQEAANAKSNAPRWESCGAEEAAAVGLQPQLPKDAVGGWPRDAIGPAAQSGGDDHRSPLSPRENPLNGDTADIVEDPATEVVFQQWTRSQLPDGSQQVFATLRAELSPGQRTASVHLAFCPPLPLVPEIEFEQIDGPEARIQQGEVYRHGARLDVRLAETATEACWVVIEVAALAATATHS